ncbi:MAG TPA: hypothetical protein DCS07_12030 [Bdellovibrionales bacterium]|nr:MAG: hypothetical protein A2Z97_13360 [Bdellovibrionales bacterium GWB1_52_6]OFZ03157.1 MAG: hypothetical protein A2X97_04030 [Bdellovibrionales bacterium GWA1_52_35]OFZ43661.1 MAG: hypothetical protein A2070_04500 [Bdellovibrionales bacterium GWC1_52_8]HAR43337.1 hypothetical protein [Bdellovibrionales bacterium]HCM38350.1 hypothetical protein [Bdellovibrionales bacterium]
MTSAFKKYWAWIIVAALFAAYAPYIGIRYVRTLGDEKVYVSQALEMARDGRWFIQTLGDVPAYYKGPVHYVLVRLGVKVFGFTPWAVLYMNLLFAMAGALALGALIKRRLPEWEEGPVWGGVGFGLCVGIYAHTFASQMEVELAGTAAVALYLLDRLGPRDAGYLFWIVAGFAGWIKAPLHSAFLGVGALIYWTLSGEIFARLRNPKAWLAVLTGIVVGFAGYLPAALLDWQNFYERYLLAEIVNKASTWQTIWTPIVSTYGFYLFPWLSLAVVAYVQGLWQLPRMIRESAARRLLLLSISFSLPSLGFFIYHPFRLENYNLPFISGVFLLVGLIWSRRNRFFEWFYSLGFALTAALSIGFPVFISAMHVRFSPLPEWWPAWLLPVVWVGGIGGAYAFIRYGVREKGRRPGHLSLASVGLFWALGGFFSVVGEREMVDIRAYLKQADARGEKVTLSYYNLMGNIWNEWGLLNFWVDHPVQGIHTEEKLRQAIENGDTILLSAGEGHEDFKKFVQKTYPLRQFTYIPWKRWQTHGGADTGRPLWKDAWDRRDFTLLERNFYIVRTEPAT